MAHLALANRYASALVDVAVSPKAGADPHQVLQDLRSFEQTFENSAELRNALVSPSVPPARKRAVVGGICEKLGISRIVRNFLFVLADHRRLALLGETIESFDLLMDERLGYTRAEVSSAREMDQRQRDTISKEMERLTGKKVRMRFAVDSTLVGGLVARIGSTVYDGSVRGQLQSLGKRLAD